MEQLDKRPQVELSPHQVFSLLPDIANTWSDQNNIIKAHIKNTCHGDMSVPNTGINFLFGKQNIYLATISPLIYTDILILECGFSSGCMEYSTSL